MDPEAWRARWREGTIGFHEAATNTFLTAHADRLGSPGRVFVPLCGKSRDMAYLASLGHSVVGVDVSEIAAPAFFAESGLEPVRSRRGPFEAFSAGGVEILVGDVFLADRALLGPFDAIYDRAALVALTPGEQAPRYAAHLASLLREGGRMLLVTFDYDQSKMEGPPFAVSPGRVRDLFGGTFEIEHLADRDVTDERPRFREAGADRVTESAWLLVRRPLNR
jgi:thiopurine S-methyltransferase